MEFHNSNVKNNEPANQYHIINNYFGNTKRIAGEKRSRKKTLEISNKKLRLEKKYLEETDVNMYKYIDPELTALGEFVFKRTYARLKQDETKESWYEVVYRVIDGAYKILDNTELSNSHKPKQMFDYLFNMKFMPAGRSLYIGGTEFMMENLEKIPTNNADNSVIVKSNCGGMALNSCAFISFNEYVKKNEPEKPFIFLMSCLMLGTGVGYDTYYEGELKGLYKPVGLEKHIVGDSREGWTKSVELLLQSYFQENKKNIEFDYSQVRKAGEKLKKFGGTTSGPDCLRDAHENIRIVLNKHTHLTSRVITDIMCLITGCIVTAGSRRGATIAFCKPNDDDFISIKDYDLEINKDRVKYGWAVNNTVLFENVKDCDKETVTKICARIKKNGEPGVGFLDNMKKYSRMCDEPTYADMNVMGGNPCCEQCLESSETCNLVEVFMNKINSFDEFISVLEYAFLYGKIITTVKTHNDETNEIIRKNRRIGCSLSGIAQFLSKHSMDVLRDWIDKGYKHLKMFDKKISKIMDINESVKITSVKPSGTISLLANASPGVHYPMSNYYIRRVRLNKMDPLVEQYVSMGYNVVDDVIIKENVIVEFPISMGENVKYNVSVDEQMEISLLMQKYWADNMVSVTLNFDTDVDEHHLAKLIYDNKQYIKCVSFLPKMKDVYPQMPYEAITKNEYEVLIEQIKTRQIIDTQKTKTTKFCDSECCIEF